MPSLCAILAALAFFWTSTSTFKSSADFLSGCDGLGIASYLGLANLAEKFSLQVQDIDACQPIYPARITEYTALIIAIEQGFSDVVRVLERESDSSLQVKYGKSPLHEALQGNPLVPISDRLAIVQLLLDSDLDIGSKIVDGNTALYHATLFSSKEVVEFLAQEGANLEAPTGVSNWTPLQEAVSLGYECSAADLLEHGADFNAHTNSKNIIFPKASEFGSVVMYSAIR